MKALVIGGGIGGFVMAMSLHRVGIECEVFEQSAGVRELGVGINTLPHAIKELAELGLLDALDKVAVRTHELIYKNRFGQTVWQEPRGTDAGYDFPQFSIHRGHLQGVLYEGARARIGDENIHLGHQFTSFDQDDNGVTATFTLRDGTTATATGDLLIACDGIHSKVRASFYPDQGPPTWNGILLWRGAIEHKKFLTGRSMIIAGGMKAKLVLYPISNNTGSDDTNLLNWAVAAKLGDGSTPMPNREDWNRKGKLDELLAHVEGVFELDEVDPVEVIKSTPEFFEYPMCDRDPIPNWSFGRVTLLGDSAHPMYPVGSNGASQAILDARCLSDMLGASNDIVQVLKDYSTERVRATTEIVRQNRGGGPERVIDVIEERAPDGFDNIDEVASHDEREAIVKGYSTLAGYEKSQVNK
ncbi:MAG: flavin-dependent oxidoreductase [Rhizobiales bacterium]|nr:flavin-dependent oxidoreductase [Hyphomicrobiales bacterium]